ncbi:DUF4062 domain-containing protein [Lacticaseibacillus kribbianus]|uniref:DUF4062 domain-containing protein n=1 Tax=Lacticaseibacillus kribbianus TaxID=2926292 RepID=UPI001CD4DBDC|nr:DUF4062 domain-containing protein [Lacticaseibacillus kribbianus]
MKFKRRYQIFVSSTFQDLNDERVEVVMSILKSGHIPVGMELFTGTGKQQEIIARTIEESDMVVLIIGMRYGSLIENSEISYTEWEYQQALASGKPVIVLSLSDQFLAMKLRDDDFVLGNAQMADPKYKQFKQKVLSENWVEIIENIDQIDGRLSHSIDSVINDYGSSLIGWVSGQVITELESRNRSVSELTEQKSASERRAIRLEKQVQHAQNDDKLSSEDIADISTRLKQRASELEKKRPAENAIALIGTMLKDYLDKLIVNGVDTKRLNISTGAVLNTSTPQAYLKLEDHMLAFIYKDYQTIRVRDVVLGGKPRIKEDALNILDANNPKFISSQFNLEISEELINKYMDDFITHLDE